jgi:hypothetical protein
MNWPWTSRARLDNALGQVDYLREQLSRASLEYAAVVAQLTRIGRREAGMPEVPREARPAMEPMPSDLRQYISGYANANVRREMMSAAYRQHAAGKPWSEIASKAMTPREVP